MTATLKYHPERSEGSAFLRPRRGWPLAPPRRARCTFQFLVSSFQFLVSRFSFLTCALCGLVVCSEVRADEFPQTSHYAVRMFSVGTLTLETRMGDIFIEGWDEPRLEVEAEKVVRAKSADEAQPFFERVRLEFEGQDKAVRLRTVYPPRRPWRPLRGESKLSVNLRVKMPSEANLKLHCVDGDVRVEGISGHQVLLVNYGDVEIDVPDVYRLRSLNAHAWLGYVQTDLHSTGDQDSSGLYPRLSFWNSHGNQDIVVRVRMGGVWVYGYSPIE
jgi:hypothetical protein